MALKFNMVIIFLLSTLCILSTLDWRHIIPDINGYSTNWFITHLVDKIENSVLPLSIFVLSACIHCGDRVNLKREFMIYYLFTVFGYILYSLMQIFINLADYAFFNDYIDSMTKALTMGFNVILVLMSLTTLCLWKHYTIKD